MPVDRLAPNQVINRQARATMPSFGALDLITLGEITNAVSTTTLPTGQTRTTGMPTSVDVQGSVMFADKAAVARIEAWKNLGDQGAAQGVQEGVAFQYYKEDGTPGPLVVAEEVQCTAIVYPSTDVSASGDGAQLGFTMSVFNAKLQPGSG